MTLIRPRRELRTVSRPFSRRPLAYALLALAGCSVSRNTREEPAGSGGVPNSSGGAAPASGGHVGAAALGGAAPNALGGATSGSSGAAPRGGAGSSGGGGALNGGGGPSGSAGTTGGSFASGGASGGRAAGGTSATGTGGAPTAGASGNSAASGNGGAGASGGLPALHVDGNKLEDPTGKTIVLRGSSLIDIGALYAYNGNSVSGISGRMDKVAAAGVQGHVVRLPVYPKINYNPGGSPACSPLSYPVGSGPSAACTPTASLSGPDYVSKVLKPAVDYATSKNLYVIVDFHQIDSIATGNSAADANTFWSAVAPVFASYGNVLYEPFNEPTDYSSAWSTLKPVVQSFIDTIRAGAPNNVIIVPSQSWDQHPGDAANDPPTGSNLMYTAHIYPSNWNTAFQSQVTAASAKVPVFVTEWGYASSDPDPHTWGVSLQSVIDGSGASFTAWVTDNAWTPSMFSNASLTSLTDFGMLVQSWLASKANSDWVW